MVYTAQDLSISVENVRKGAFLLFQKHETGWMMPHTDKYGNAFTPSIMTVDIVLGIWLPTPAGTARNDISIISNLCQIASARIKNERQRKQRYNEPAPQQ